MKPYYKGVDIMMNKTYQNNEMEIIRIYNGGNRHEYVEIEIDDYYRYYNIKTVREDYDYYENEW